MNSYWTKSLILHIAVILCLVFSGLSFCSRQDDKHEEQSITVELMPIGAKTNIKPAPKQEKKPTPVQKKKNEPKKEEEEPKEKEKPKEEKPKEEPKPTTKPTEVKPKEAEKTKEKPKDAPKKQDSAELDNLLKTLDNKKPAKQTESQQTQNTDAKSQSVTPVDTAAPLTMAEIDYIKTLIMNQITPCWNMPAGAKDAGALQIKLDVDVDRDGSIKFVGFSDEARYNSDTYYQVAADSARRATLDPKCNPLKQLPPMDKFDKWHELTLTFDPSKMIH